MAKLPFDWDLAAAHIADAGPAIRCVITAVG